MNLTWKPLLPLAIAACLLTPLRASAQSNDNARTVLSAVLEAIQGVGGDVVRDVRDASRDVYDDFFGGDNAPPAAVNEAMGVYGLPDVSLTRDILQEEVRNEITPEDLSSNPALMAAVGGESILHTVLEETIDQPLSLEAQEQLSVEQEEHLEYLWDSLQKALTTTDGTFELSDRSLSYDTTGPVQELEDWASSARQQTATQDVLKDMASALPVLGRQSQVETEILQLMTNQLHLLNEGQFYTTATLFKTQTNLERLALESRFDRAIQGNLLLSNERANNYERMLPHVNMRADAVGLVELSANIGFARETGDD